MDLVRGEEGRKIGLLFVGGRLRTACCRFSLRISLGLVYPTSKACLRCWAMRLPRGVVGS